MSIGDVRTATRFVFTAFMLTLNMNVLAQQGRIIPVEDWSNRYIARLQQRGFLLELNPTALPYQEGEIVSALEGVDEERLGPYERRWFSLLRQEFLPTGETRERGTVLGASFETGITAGNNDRLDPLRPIDTGRPTLTLGDVRLFPRAFPRVRLGNEHVVAQVGFHHNVFYDVDPDGIDSVTRLYIRSEDSYLGATSRFASAYAGRFSNHWAPFGQTALAISRNPRSYDQISIRLGARKIAFRSLLGELDSITGDGRFSGAAGADSVGTGSERRYVAAHRFDWRPTPHFMVSVIESALYSGATAGGSLKYLNPLHLLTFTGEERPKNEEVNGFVGGLLWARLGRVTLQGQLLLDDLDLMNQSGEPLSAALSGSLHISGIAPALDAGTSWEVVTARAYNTAQPEGKYLYLLRGLGTQFNDYVQGSFYADLFLDACAPGLALRPQVLWLFQGEQDVRRTYPANKGEAETLLTGTVQKTLRAGMELYYQPTTVWWLRLDLGANLSRNDFHVEGRRRERFIAVAEIGARVSVERLLDGRLF